METSEYRLFVTFTNGTEILWEVYYSAIGANIFRHMLDQQNIVLSTRIQEVISN
jgi:hypothetical protein